MKCLLTTFLVLSSVSTFGAVSLPMTDRTVSAFFRFDDPSAWGKDSGPLGSSLSSKSGSSSAGLKTGDGSLVDAECAPLIAELRQAIKELETPAPTVINAYAKFAGDNSAMERAAKAREKAGELKRLLDEICE